MLQLCYFYRSRVIGRGLFNHGNLIIGLSAIGGAAGVAFTGTSGSTSTRLCTAALECKKQVIG